MRIANALLAMTIAFSIAEIPPVIAGDAGDDFGSDYDVMSVATAGAVFFPDGDANK